MSYSSSMICEMRGKWPYSWCLTACFFQDLFQYSSVVPILLLLKIASLNVKRCAHTVVLTRLQCVRIPVLFYQRSYCHVVVNLAVVVHNLYIHVLTWLSVDEIFLLLYKKWSNNFSLDIYWGDGTILIKTQGVCLIWIRIRASASSNLFWLCSWNLV